MAASKSDKAKSQDKDLGQELIELLNELRVALPGVQVLFAFLLTVPFTQVFKEVTPLQRNMFFTALMTATISALLLIAPSAHHRLEWREREEEYVLRSGNRFTIAGLLFLAVSMTLVVFVIADRLFDGLLPALSTSVIGLGFLYFWYVMPVARLIRHKGRNKTG